MTTKKNNKEKKVLVTGGCGYIGTHTLVDLIEHGYTPICIDNNSRSTEALLKGVKEITGKQIVNHKIDLVNLPSIINFFEEHHNIDGIIHFAAYKSVNESVENPLMYLNNNLISLLNLLTCAEQFKVPNFIFSSSCSVYGNVDEMPVKENTILGKAESPYGLSKRMGEELINSVAAKSFSKFISLRYFNPAGAHPSGVIGEVPTGKPSNLVPAITWFAAGKLPAMSVFGTDYETRDGSCIRDFVHVCDIAHAHTLAMQYLEEHSDAAKVETINLGTGIGVTVLETLKAFEQVANMKLAYQEADRREGDVVAIYADNEKASKMLKWSPQYQLQDIMKTAWKWELRNQKQE